MSSFKFEQNNATSLFNFFVYGLKVVVVFLVPVAAIWFLLTGCSDIIGGANKGYGDTVISYADRTYEGANWIELHEAAALSEAAKTRNGVRIGALKVVTGLDKDNLWVVDTFGNLFRLKAGHWSYERPVAGGIAYLQHEH